MSERFPRGLVVGKFCPLHLGHELLIETALSRCDELLVISYTKPAFERCEAAARERWLRERFPSVRLLVLDDARLAALTIADGSERPSSIPHNDAAEEAHRRFVGWLCCHVFGCSVAAVFTSEDYGDGFAQSLSSYFREQIDERHADVEHVCVDRSRRARPVSGTAVRNNPAAWRGQLSPQVYADLTCAWNRVRRVCFLGGESSGKTTLARALAKALSTTWVAEYGRDLWVERGGALRYEDMLHIARTQVAHEDMKARQADRWLFCDTSPLTTLLYCRDLFGHAEVALEQLAGSSYEHVFLCSPDLPFEQDGTRRDDAFRRQQHAWYVRELTARRMDFTLIEGSHAQRMLQARRLLAEIIARSNSGLVQSEP